MREMRDPGCDNQNVSPTPAQQAQAARITAEIAALGFALPGTLADRMMGCLLLSGLRILIGSSTERTGSRDWEVQEILS
jgi:hypothetical protein